jgi:hypothetical protein
LHGVDAEGDRFLGNTDPMSYAAAERMSKAPEPAMDSARSPETPANDEFFS